MQGGVRRENKARRVGGRERMGREASGGSAIAEVAGVTGGLEG